jgi:hypothetical protein
VTLIPPPGKPIKVKNLTRWCTLPRRNTMILLPKHQDLRFQTAVIETDRRRDQKSGEPAACEPGQGGRGGGPGSRNLVVMAM